MNQSFSTMDVGRKIKELRLKNDLTQMNLADAMGVSYQAVSNWERGNSMPDISKLGELAELLGCSIDELLGSSKETELVKSVMEMEKNGEESIVEMPDVETLSHIAPVLKPTQVQNLSNRIVQTAKEAGTKILPEQIEEMAPFLDKDSLEEMVEAAMENGSIKIQDVENIAPFLSQNVLMKLAKMARPDEISVIADLAPFMDGEDLGKIAVEAARNGGNADDICDLAPFLKKDALDELANCFYDTNQIEACEELYPFLGKESVQKLLQKMMQKGKIEELRDIMPFI